jgi:hypothetical protein
MPQAQRARKKRTAGVAPPPYAGPAQSAQQTSEAIPEEEIARLAHSYWEARGCQGGSAEEDWLRAERELRAARAGGA